MSLLLLNASADGERAKNGENEIRFELKSANVVGAYGIVTIENWIDAVTIRVE